jgi:hypothetical protein
MREKSYLKQDVSFHVTQTDLSDAAQAFVDIAKNASMTGQKVQVGRFSNCIVNHSSTDSQYGLWPWSK